ncbi:HGL056Cp [Eremothecium sinecaudum]|uniref:HGL056Cp n=1 Tax=Eremothecium sinecaudum TaxID=45286 RepID=A0A0X8HVP0_9SACH|nr:HGL056Cp [Eremothecium sinecaudum]AMD22284.1 HGL056Cp [Eremothecium sinecaudum]
MKKLEQSSNDESNSNVTAVVEFHPPVDKGSLEYIVKSGIAGGVAGSCAKTLIAPLDRIKILFQTSNPHYKRYAGSMSGMVLAGKEILINDGFRGFFQGHSATLVRIFPYAAIKFIAYEQIRSFIIPSYHYESHWRRLLSGSLSGLCSIFVTYPLDVIRVRMAYETKRSNVSIIKILKDIYSGPISEKLASKPYVPKWFPHWCNFYRGYTPSVIGMIPYAGVSFFAHDLFHDILRCPMLSQYSVLPEGRDNPYDRSIPLKSWAQLVAGGLAGIASQTAAYPFEIIRRRLQVATLSSSSQGQFLGINEIAKIIYKESGWRGFFVGLSIGYLKVTPMVACSFYVYERMKWYLQI